MSLLLPGCASQPRGVDIVFGEVGSAPDGFVRAGECRYATWSQTRAVIVLNKVVWDRLTKAQRELLIKHEIGHCRDGLQHTETGYMKPVLD